MVYDAAVWFEEELERTKEALMGCIEKPPKALLNEREQTAWCYIWAGIDSAASHSTATRMCFPSIEVTPNLIGKSEFYKGEIKDCMMKVENIWGTFVEDVVGLIRLSEMD